MEEINYRKAKEQAKKKLVEKVNSGVATNTELTIYEKLRKMGVV